MNNKNTKNNILHKIMVLLVVFSVAVIDTVPLWVNARDVTKEEVHTEGMQEGTKEGTEEELVEETKGESLEELELEEDNGENKKGEEGNEKTEEVEDGSLEEYTNTISGKTEETGISLMSFNVQNVGSYTPRTKQITGHNSSEYDDGEFRGTLERYVMSGSPADTKTVTGQTSENYNKDGYTGTLTQYLESGLPSDTKHVTGQPSASYNKDGYKGTLTQYVTSGSPADTKYVTNQPSISYHSGGYTGELTQYLHSGSASQSKEVSGQTSPNYSDSSGYTGTLTKYTYSGSASNTKFVSNRTSPNYSDSSGYTGTLTKYRYSGSYTPSATKTVREDIEGSIRIDKETPKSTISYNSDGYSGTLSLSSSTWRPTRGSSSGRWSTYSNITTGTLSEDGPSTYIISQVKNTYTNQGYQDVAIDGASWEGGIQGPGTYISSSGIEYSYKRSYRVYFSYNQYQLNATYRGDVTRPASDTRVYRYRGDVSKPDTRVYRYKGTVSTPDTRVYRYRGDVSKPDTRQYAYEGNVTRPDSRVYKYEGNVSKPDTRVYGYRGTVYEIDKDAPEITIVTDGNSNPRTSHSTVVNVVDDYSGVELSQYQWTTSPEFPTGGTWSPFTSGDTITRSTGTDEYYLHIVAQDSEGNISQSTSKAFNVENTPPKVPTLVLNTTGYTNQDVIVTINYENDLNTKQYKVGNGSWQNYTSPVVVSSNDTVYARETSRSGLTSNTGSIKVTNIDKSAPNGTITGNPTSWTNSNITLTFNATDTGGSGVRRVRRPNGTWVNGSTTTHVVSDNGTYVFTVEDNAGNTRDVSVNVNRIDKTAPELNVTGNPTDYTGEDEITLAVTTSDTLSGVRRITLPNNKVVTSSNATYTVVENGDYVFKVEDNAGNITTRTVTVDKLMIHYYLYLRDSKGNPVKDSTFELLRDGKVYRTSTTDDKGYLDFGKVPPVGKYTLKQVTNSDGIGIKDPEEKDVYVDNPIKIDNPIEIPIGETLEEPVLTSNLNTWTNKEVKVTINYSTESTIKQYKVNDGEWEEYTQPITLAENSKVYARSYDDVGNWSPETSVNITNIDTTPVRIEYELNTIGWATGVTLTVTSTDTESGFKSITVSPQLEQVTQTTINNVTMTTYNVNSNGTYTFTVTDNAGNITIDTFTVGNVDTVKPEIEIPNVPTEYYRRYEYVLDVNVSDEESGVASVTLPDGNVVTGEDLTDVTYTVTDNGAYTFTVEDNVGNEETITITITHLQAEQSMRLVDSSGRPLQGGVFELYWDGKLIERKETDVNGEIDFGLLYTSGEYELKQVRVLDGYRLNSEVIDFQVPEDVTIINYKKSEELPSTGTRDDLILLVMGLATITVITVTNKKRRKLSKEV